MRTSDKEASKTNRQAHENQVARPDETRAAVRIRLLGSKPTVILLRGKKVADEVANLACAKDQCHVNFGKVERTDEPLVLQLVSKCNGTVAKGT